MCGIGGIINKDGSAADEQQLKRLSDCVSHRGPDGDGLFIHENVGLIHRRLSILDLSTASSQPFYYKEFVLVFNGAIYNYLEIRKELEQSGSNFKTTGDTEVLLHAYAMWGPSCVSKFNGMWSFVIYNRNTKQLFASRDRFGVKPFYYISTDKTFAFGSEIRQLLQLHKPVAEYSVLADYLITGLEEISDKTFFKGILRLLPGHNLTYDCNSGSMSVSKYYELKGTAITFADEQEAVNYFTAEFNRSVQYRLRSDVKVGTCLSGGLDSSSIATVAGNIYSAATGNKFTGITASSTEKKTDETHYAEAVAKAAGLDWHTVKPGFNEYQSLLHEVITTQEEPFGSPSVFMQYIVMKEAAALNCKVMLDGQGGDETLMGYDRYYPAYILSGNLFSAFTRFINSSKYTKWNLAQSATSIAYFTNADLRLKRALQKSAFLNKSVKDQVNRNVIQSLADAYRDVNELQKLEITKTQLPHLLRYEDKNSMKFAVETRLPFLDYRLVELSLGLKFSYKFNKGYSKYILRKSMEPVLPAEVAWRRNKFGFEAPVDTWMQDKTSYLNAIRNSPLINSIAGSIPDQLSNNQLWRLYNVAIWEKIYEVGR